MLPLVPLSLPIAPRLKPEEDTQELHSRMQKPQRHRLLHGYPLATAMKGRQAGQEEGDLCFTSYTGRSLLIGVLPHPFCNPAVTGCGFCTFPHEAYQAARAATVVEHVIREIEQRVARQRALYRRPVAGLYFGGGTANLTPAGSFRGLCRRLAATFDLTEAEITLEGVPIYFIKRQPLLMDILREEIPARHFRISMGIQTFQEDQLRRMGRTAFGTAATFREVVELGHARGFTVSADLLFNLPHQTLSEMRDDISQGADIGLDHMGLYHLVLFAGLRTAWSRDPALLANLPANEAAAGNWLHLREAMLARGFCQTTLTNFERAELAGQAQRFIYEESSFRPGQYEMLGFGPSGISWSASRDFRKAVKTLNPERSDEYLAAVARGRPVWNRSFRYEERDLRIFYLTRRLAALHIDRTDYRSLFGSDPLDDFHREFATLAAEQLVDVTECSIRPTPRGMFYADSIAALLAWRRVHELRSPKPVSSDTPANDNSVGYM